MKVTDFIISTLIFLSLFAIKINAIESEADASLAVSLNEQILNFSKSIPIVNV